MSSSSNKQDSSSSKGSPAIQKIEVSPDNDQYSAEYNDNFISKHIDPNIVHGESMIQIKLVNRNSELSKSTSDMSSNMIYEAIESKSKNIIHGKTEIIKRIYVISD